MARPSASRGALVVGSRGSRLALAQTREVVDALRQLHPHLAIDVREVHTTGDRDQASSLAVIGGQGVFVKELEVALLDGRIDLAVHSLKDVPTTLLPGLTLAAITQRLDVRDAFVSRDGRPLAQMPPAARIGTGSGRRAVQVRALRPDVAVVDIRGNVDTRLRKLDEGQVDGLVLAAVGLARLGLPGRAAELLPAEVMLPAVGQGAMAVEARVDDTDTIALVAALDHPPTRQAVTAERAYLRRLGGGCRLPVAAYAVVEGEGLRLHALIADAQGERILRAQEEGPAAAADAIGTRLGDKLLALGAADLIAAQEVQGWPPR